MAGFFVIGTLAAFGLFSALWALLGWLLPDGTGCVLVCCGTPDEGMISRYRWLRGAGFLRCPMVAVDAEHIPPEAEIERCAGEMLLSRLKWERNHSYGTGTGDPTGHDQCCGLSEL